MADDAATSTEETQVTFNVKSANDQKFVITVSASSTVADLKIKLSTSEYADIPAERQRLIYSGRVLKDPDTLAGVKIKDGHTVHLVKGAASNARQNPANAGSSAAGSGTPAPQVPAMATGTGNNPLAGLTGARYAGFHGLPGADMFGPDGGMGPPPDPSQLLEMMENPMFLTQMNEAMNNPQVIEMMTQSPMIRNNPMLAQMIRNPEMRRMLFNPEMMRMQLQMQREMGGAGGPRMTAPGVTDTTPQPSSTVTGDGTSATPNQPNTTGPTQTPDLSNLFGGAGGANPFASLLGGAGAGGSPFGQQQQNQGQNTSGTTEGTQNTQPPPPNPFAGLFGAGGAGGAAGGQGGQGDMLGETMRQMMQNPEMMRSAMNMASQMQGGGGGFSPFGAAAPSSTQDASSGNAGAGQAAANPFASLFGPGGFGAGAGGFGTGTPPPQDNRPPEEVYQQELRQLNDMGFYEFERNVTALRRSGGNVQGAIDYLLGGGT